MSAGAAGEFTRLMEPVARALLGEPGEKHHGGQEWRYGTRGSLSIRVDEGTWYDNQAGCGGGTLDLIRVRKKLDKEGALDWLAEQKLITGRPKIVATYDYKGADGALLYQVVRFDPKDFRQRRPNGPGKWLWKMQGVQRVPYRLPELLTAIGQGRAVYIAEGEKGVNSLVGLGLDATCSPGGAGKWRLEYNRHFAGADVVILPDNDPQATDPNGAPRWHPDGRPVLPGQDHAADVAKHLRGIATRVRVVMLPGLPIKGDVFDWITAGGTAAQLAELAEGVAPIAAEAAAPSQDPAPDPAPQLAAAAPTPDDQAAAQIAAVVAELNARYMMVSEGGRATIYAPAHDPVLNRSYFDRMSATDLRLLYLNRTVFVGNDEKGNPIMKAAAEIWLRHKDRRQFIGGVTFDPSGQRVGPDTLNLWRGFGVKPQSGKWGRLKRHIFDVICGKDSERFSYLMNWMCRMVQHPAQQGEVAVVMRGGEGTGKGTLARALCYIMGQHGMAISNSKHLTGNFNGHLRDCVFLFADEAFYAGDPSHVGVLKSIITEPHLTIEAKYANAVQMPNFLHLMMASNEEWVVPAALDARRFLVLEVSEAHANDHPWFAAIWQEMEAGGYEAMLQDLLSADLSGFNVRNFPLTEGLQRQKQLTLGTSEAWWLDVLHRGYVYRSKLGLEAYFSEWREEETTEVLFASYSDFAAGRRERHPMAREAFGRFLLRVGAKSIRVRNAVVGEHIADVVTNQYGDTSRKAELIHKVVRSTGYSIGTLGLAREAFTAATGLAPDWPDDDAEPVTCEV